MTQPLAQRVLITGATSGIGQQLALDYAAAGWKVLACGRNPTKLAALKEQAATQGQSIQTLTFDLNQRQEVLDAGTVLPHAIDLLILNAGTCEYIDDARQFDSSLLERVVRTNLLGVGYCLEAFLRHVPPGGQLALVGSSASFFPFARAEAYGASKAAVAYLAESLAVDLAPHRISVSLISPGFVETPLTDRNDFAMPLRISVQAAAQAIRRGLARRHRHICPPRRLTWPLRLMGKLPRALRHYLALKLVNS